MCTLKAKVILEQVKFWRVRDLDNLELLRVMHMNDSSARHIHETFAIGIVEQGKTFFNYRNEAHFAYFGSVVVINPGDVHANGSLLQESCTYRMMYPSNALLQQAMCKMTGEGQKIPLFSNPIIQDNLLAQKIYKFHQDLETPPHLLESEAILIEILTQLFGRYADEKMAFNLIGKENRAVGQIKDYLQANYTANVSLKQLSQITHLSPFHLTRVFCREVGLPPHAYLTQLRVVQAKKLLSQNWEISQVAVETGFTHQSHLNRHFKRIMGVTPRQYKLMSKNVQD